MFSLPRKKGRAMVAVNEWLSYYNIRMNYIELFGGQEAVVQVQPVQHVATERFRTLDVGRRKCLFPEERMVLSI